MPAHKNIGRMCSQSRPNAFGISPRSASNVGHPNAASFALNVLMFGKIPAQELVVNVAVYRNQGGHGCQRIGDFEVPNVPRMPDFITRGEVMENAVVHMAVGIADQSNAHASNFGFTARMSPSWRFTLVILYMRLRFALLVFLMLGVVVQGWAQPGARLHTESKKATKLYRKAMETSRAAMGPGVDKAAAQLEVEANLIKSLEVDPMFAEAERVLAALRFDQGQFEAARDHYAHYLSHCGQDWIRDHMAWAESARHALDPEGMKAAMMAMRSIPGVLEGPDVRAIERVLMDADFISASLADPAPLQTDPLPFPVSTSMDEYFPSPWQAGEALVFTRRLENARRRQGQEDLFVSFKDNGSWSEPQPLRGINTVDNEGAGTLSGDGMTLCFTICRDADRPGEGPHKGSCDLYIAERVGQGWGVPQNLGAVNSPAWESQPCLSPDGQQLYFTRGSGRAGRRKHDIFTALRNPDGTWGAAYRIGGNINSSGQEMRPFIHPDGRHLYFATDGRVGMGGMDLYVCERDERGQWGEPVNLGWPLNTPDDESGMVVASDGVTGYFSRSVEGQMDLHQTTLPPSVSADPTVAMEGKLLSSTNKPIAGGRISLVGLEDGVAFAEAIASLDGHYHVPVPLDRSFVVLAQGEGYMLHSERIERGELNGVVQRDFRLSELAPGAEVVLKNVFFESGSATLDASSGAELQRVGAWLAANPQVVMEVGGHTDNVGSAQENQSLSEQRAAVVKSALEDAGASPDQLVAQGYGQSRPAVQGDTDTARQQNRRTTLMVLPVR